MPSIPHLPEEVWLVVFVGGGIQDFMLFIYQTNVPNEWTLVSLEE